MKCLMLWFKENVSLLFSRPFSNDIALKSKLIEWGNKCFGQVYRALLAVNHLHFCSEHLMLQLLGSTDRNHMQCRRRSLLRDPHPLSHQLCHCLCQWSCGSPSWAADTAGFFNDTQASCVIWKLSHFLPCHNFCMEYLRSCIQSSFGVSLLYAV